jgi:hypothetical protein
MIFPDQDENLEIFQELNVRIKLCLILCHVDTLPGNDREISKNYNKHICMATTGNNYRRMVFSVRPVLRRYKQDS